MKPAMVRISCDGSSAPGLDWNIDVEFRPLTKGFSIWCRQNNAISDGGRGWHKVGQSNEVLGWRSISRYLNNDRELHVRGDFYDVVQISGLDHVSSDFVKSCFVIDEDSYLNYKLITQLFMGFDDTEVSNILEQLGALIVTENENFSENHELLNSITKLADKHGLVGLSLASMLRILDLPISANLEEIDEKLQAINLDSNLSALLEAYKSSLKHHILAVKWLKILNGPSLTLENTLELLILWLSHDEIVSVQSGEMHGDWAFFRWFFASAERAELLVSALQNSNPLLAQKLAEKIMTAGKQESKKFEPGYRFVGGAMAPLGKRIAQAKVNLAKDWQDVFNRLTMARTE